MDLPPQFNLNLDSLSPEDTKALLTEYHRRFWGLMSRGKLCSVCTDLNGNVTFMNNHLLELTQRTKEEVIGANYFNLFIPDKKREQISTIHLNICEEGLCEFLGYIENEILAKSGRRIMIGWTNYVMRDLSGKITGTCSVGKEVVSLSQISGFISSSSTSSSAQTKKALESTEGLTRVGDYYVYDNESLDRVKIGLNMQTNDKVAIKIIKKENLKQKDFERARREIYILQQLTKLNHPNIAKIFYWEENSLEWRIVMEYVTGGELLQHILSKSRLSELEAQRMFRQILSAVKCCHDNNIVHRDIKHNNLLLDDKKNVKLIDFGLSNYAEEGVLRSTFCGSPAYAAPEILLGKEYDGYEVDIWSLGVVLYSMVTGEFPFKTISDILSNQWTKPSYATEEYLDLISKIFVDRKLRFRLDDVINHPWVKKEVQTTNQNVASPSSFTFPSLSSSSSSSSELNDMIPPPPKKQKRES